VLYDDRDTRAGVMFADADLLGIPHQIVVGAKGLEKGLLEYRLRKTGESQEIELDEIELFITEQIQA
jgi:prolyl-tRNA synthetase